MIWIGLDPGVGGGIACIGEGGGVGTYKMKDATESDIEEWLCNSWKPFCSGMAVIEKVSSTPQMGVVSAFTFGRSYGFLRGLLTAMKIPFEEVSPQKWQKELNCRTKGDKNVSKARAQQLFPTVKVTHAIGDALCMAEFCRRTYNQRNGTV